MHGTIFYDTRSDSDVGSKSQVLPTPRCSLPEFERKGGVKYQSGADENKVWGGLVAFPLTPFVGALISVSESLGLRTSSCAS